jgi:hypothetical protein
MTYTYHKGTYTTLYTRYACNMLAYHNLDEISEVGYISEVIVVLLIYMGDLVNHTKRF